MFFVFNKTFKSILTKIKFKSYEHYENFNSKANQKGNTLSKPNEVKAYKDDSMAFYLIKIKSRTSYCRIKTSQNKTLIFLFFCKMEINTL